MPRFPAAIAERAASLLVLLGAWEGAAWFAHSRLFPGPGIVLATLAEETIHGDLLYHLGATLARVAVAFALAMTIGSAIGIAMARSRALDALLDSWVVLFLNLPALVLAVLLYVWLGLTEAAAIGAVTLSKLPTVVVTLREGARALDGDLAAMAKSFRLSAWRTLRHVTLPQLSPFFVIASRTGLALIWKIVLVVELLNTALEKLSDQVTPNLDPKIGFVKDLGSAAVGLALILAALVWLVALAERFGIL